MIRKSLVLPALLGMLAPVLASCGMVGDSGGDGDAITVGTTDRLELTEENPAPLDPATAYDINSWNVLHNTFQTLMRMPRTGSEPEPDAAERCVFADRRSEQYRCTLRDGLTFTNGHDLTAEDVKFSIERMLKIKYDNGPYSLLTNVDTVETPDERTVVFHLKTPDATFPLKLATPAAAIVDSEVYAKDELYDGFEIAGSGPYSLEVEHENDVATKAVYTGNEDYKGEVDPQNDGVEVRYFDDAKSMEDSISAGDIDVMGRSLKPEQINRLDEGDSDVNLFETPGAEIAYLVFDVQNPTVEDVAVRRAMAELIDRTKLARDVYKRTVEPLFAMIPRGIIGHNTAFHDAYGDRPDVDSARALLREADVETPVRLTLNYTTDHYGETTKAEFEELRDQLNQSGLFDADIKGETWETFKKGYADNRYAVYGLHWYPDFPDPDTFTASFVGAENFTHNNYGSSVIEDLIPRTRQEAQRERTTDSFERIQDVLASDVPYLPLWQGKQYIAARDTVTGAEWALNSSSTLQLWELGRGLSE
ncbi:ABC transporter substrate-binding protein [Streptomyces sp. MAR4 CNX-425]|uniref:ABC transporter substrate-binding protein n=1 Tax=Streptomyces sp. MAR4 CNX-425 TaxID=3406343 RepID=UPI003B5038C9